MDTPPDRGDCYRSGGALRSGTVAAFTLTEPFVCTEENVLYRGADVTSGETYTITGDWDNGDEITLMAYGSTQAQEMENRTETYYSGPLSDGLLYRAGGISPVLFQFRGPEGTQIRSLSLSDGTKIPTSYTLLPENLVSRFQKNLFQDRSFLLRVQYLKDGWTLFTQSPLTGTAWALRRVC